MENDSEIKIKKIFIQIGNQEDLILDIKDAKKLYDALKEMFDKAITIESPNVWRYAPNTMPYTAPLRLDNDYQFPNGTQIVYGSTSATLGLNTTTNSAYLKVDNT